jgi:hypothetical protein
MKRAAILVTLVALLVLASLALAQGQTHVSAPAGPGYDLSWWTVDGGGTTFNSGGGYTLGATAGQPDAAVLAGGGYTLAGGFWLGAGAAAGPPSSGVYLPLALREAGG